MANGEDKNISVTKLSVPAILAVAFIGAVLGTAVPVIQGQTKVEAKVETALETSQKNMQELAACKVDIKQTQFAMIELQADVKYIKSGIQDIKSGLDSHMNSSDRYRSSRNNDAQPYTPAEEQ